MSGHKMGRITEDLKREIAAVIRQMKDPRLSESMLSVVRTDVAGDLSVCKVYISSLSGYSSAQNAAKVLNGAAGFIRRETASRLTLRHIPSLYFEATDSIEYGAEISRILDGLDIKHDEPQTTSSQETEITDEQNDNY